MSGEPSSGHDTERMGRTLRLSAALGVAAAVVVALLVNIVSARHYRRWDWTAGGLYTLSPVTVRTLQSLAEPVQIHVLLSTADPLTLSVRHLLETYRAQTTQLDVRYTDPDRHPAEFLAVQQRYGIVAGRTQAGRIVTDASLIVARGEHHHFVTSDELVALDEEDPTKARPRIEQVLTAAIRQVAAGRRPKACFTTGHGEGSVADLGPRGLASLAGRLTKDNYEVVELASLRELDGRDPITACELVVVAGPEQPLGPEETTRLKLYLESGGNALLAIGPVPDRASERTVDLGLQGVLDAAGIAQNDDFVFERDPRRRSSQGFGEAFLAFPKPHPVTAAMIQAAELNLELGVYLEVASSLSTVSGSSAVTTPLLDTSADAFGMTDFFSWAAEPQVPTPRQGDHRGPLTVAYASQLPRSEGGGRRGARVVVIGSSSVLWAANWRLDELEGTTIFVESALSWLAHEPVPVDVPEKRSQSIRLQLTEASLGSVMRYAVLYIPLAVALLGVAVALRRRGSKGRWLRERRPQAEAGGRESRP